MLLCVVIGGPLVSSFFCDYRWGSIERSKFLIPEKPNVISSVLRLSLVSIAMV